jgi:hypothetical protein
MKARPGDNPGAMIEYSHLIGEKRRQSNKLRPLGNSQKNQSAVMAIIEKYPVGSEVRAYYNPADPADACLETGVDVVNDIIIVTPLIFAAVVGTQLFKTPRRNPKG